MAFFDFRRLKKTTYDDDMNEVEDEYVELNVDGERSRGDAQIMVRQFMITDFSDIKPVLDNLREGYTICLLNIRPLKEKDLVELKRSINKLKKTCDAIEGDIAGFGDDYIVVTPSFARIHRSAGDELEE
jgi:SepF-like predicted cell division protein (DUF552 family)